MSRRSAFVGVVRWADDYDCVNPNSSNSTSVFGDPECQNLMRRMKSDLAPVLAAAAQGQLRRRRENRLGRQPAATVVYAAQAIRTNQSDGSVIRRRAAKPTMCPSCLHAGTRVDRIGLSCGRCVITTSPPLAPSLLDAVNSAYEGVAYRLAWRLLPQRYRMAGAELLAGGQGCYIVCRDAPR